MTSSLTFWQKFFIWELLRAIWWFLAQTRNTKNFSYLHHCSNFSFRSIEIAFRIYLCYLSHFKRDKFVSYGEHAVSAKTRNLCSNLNWITISAETRSPLSIENSREDNNRLLTTILEYNSPLLTKHTGRKVLEHYIAPLQFLNGFTGIIGLIKNAMQLMEPWQIAQNADPQWTETRLSQVYDRHLVIINNLVSFVVR